MFDVWTCVGAFLCLQSPARSSRVSRGHTAQTKHGDPGTELHQEVHPGAGRPRYSDCA